ncbi:MAG: prepilin-type N-terminal cleavage/methylation domain-containing protein [Desulfobacteraceae bacterium]|jgi:prepilin-type N-terminal cleavage/methylation domain-containing protein
MNIKNKEKGFTLIEVMMALIVFSIGTAAVITLQISAVNSNFNSYRLQVANNALNNRIERLLSMDYEEVDSQAEEQPDLSNPEFSTVWNVAENFPEPGIKSVDVTVKWSRGTTSHSLDCRFYKKKY